MTKTLRLTPSTLKGDDRRSFPWADGTRSLKIPLWTPLEKGQLFNGKIDVPTRLCHSQPHTNQRHEFDKLIETNLRRWVEWREQQGWRIAGFPKVRGPVDVPTASADLQSDPEIKWYFAEARFIRTSPLYIGFDDWIHQKERGLLYGVDVEADRPPYNDPDSPDGEAWQDTGWMSPMKWAEEHRKKLGLRREDFLMGKISDPLEQPQAPRGLSGRLIT